jgi:hypothetical protein
MTSREKCVNKQLLVIRIETYLQLTHRAWGSRSRAFARPVRGVLHHHISVGMCETHVVSVASSVGRAVQCVLDLFSAEQRVHLQYLCEVCVMENTSPTHSASTAMCKGTIYRTVDKLLTRFSRLDTQKVRKPFN